MPAYRRRRRYGGRRKNRKNFVTIPFEVVNNVTALATGSTDVMNALTFGEDIFVISVDAVLTMYDNTAGVGPILVGYHHGDLTATEVSEHLDASLNDPDDIIQKERARRPVRQAGGFSGQTAFEVLNNGLAVRTPMRISFGDGQGFGVWVRNKDLGNLTCSIRFDGRIYGRWQR